MVYYKYYYSKTPKIALNLRHGKFRMVPDI